MTKVTVFHPPHNKFMEIGGLPLPIKRTRVNPETGDEIQYTVTDYAIHCKLKEIQDYLDNHPKGRVLLFFDELN